MPTPNLPLTNTGAFDPRSISSNAALDPAIEKVKESILRSREELIEVGLRNPLVSFKESRGNRGVQIRDEATDSIYQALVNEGRSLTFGPAPEKPLDQAPPPSDNSAALAQPTDPALNGAPKEKIVDSVLETSHVSQNLQTRLLNTHRDAQLCLQEQGINCLYLAMGMLYWHEVSEPNTLRKAPLLLVPVRLERKTAGAKFRLTWTGEEIEENGSISQRLKEEYGIQLPKMSNGEDFDVAKYFEAVREAIKESEKFRVEENEMTLGLFSFAKLLIHKDLDGTTWPEGKKPWEHPLMLSLFGRGFGEAPSPLPTEGRIDEHIDLIKEFEVLDSDGSQTTVLQVGKTSDIVVEGPPGTGKSQTIVNRLVRLVAEGKSVVLLAEKQAALNVVKQRLDALGLGHLCLELHSHKTSKQEVLKELKRTLEMNEPQESARERTLNKLLEARDTLNRYRDALRQEIRSTGITPYDAIGKLLALGLESPKRLDLDFRQMKGWSKDDSDKARVSVQKLEATIREKGVPAENPFFGARLSEFLPTRRATLLADILGLKTDLAALMPKISAVLQKLGVTQELSLKEIREILVGSSDVLQGPDISNINLRNSKWVEKTKEIALCVEAGKRSQKILDERKDQLKTSAWDKDPRLLLVNYKYIGETFKRFVTPWYMLRDYWRVRTLFATNVPRTFNDNCKAMEDIIQVKADKRTIEQGKPLLNELFGQGAATPDWNKFSAISDFAASFVAKHKASSHFDTLLRISLAQGTLGCKDEVSQCLTLLSAYETKLKALLESLQYEPERKELKFEKVPLSSHLDTLTLWESRNLELDLLAAFNKVSELYQSEGLGFIVEKAKTWEHSGSALLESFDVTWLSGLVEESLRERKELSHFERGRYEETRKIYCETDKEVFGKNVQEVARRHWQNLPRYNTGGQIGVLLNEFEKKARHKPIRQLMAEAGKAIQQIKPIFLMSPISASKYLPPGSVTFDEALVDEASQIRPVDAMGAIMRARRLGVHGDPKQLPPTNFFEAMFEVSEQDESRTADKESLLDLMAAQGAAWYRLTGHYRSRHQSLIQVSNQEFYENSLRVFPSPHTDREKLGLHYHLLAETAYDRGGSRTNIREAEKVAEAVIEHAKRFPELSLGVAAFSQAQAEAIFFEVEKLRRKNTDCEPFFNAHPDESFFVKNLENVQGDERDTIMISVGYGKDAEGHLTMSFGPLNVQGGERRLNVLITRARRGCEVFTNLTPEDIDIPKTESRGVKALQTFLKYARDGETTLETGENEKYQSAFQGVLKTALEEKGYKVAINVGAIGSRVDLAVFDPEDPKRYILGILLDGTDYQNTSFSRDEERIKEEVLTSLGWNLHRSWIIEWLRNPAAELSRIEAAVKAAMGKTEQLSEQNIKVREVARIARPGGQLRNIRGIPYQKTDVTVRGGKTVLEGISTKDLAVLVYQVVKQEHPIHLEELTRRLRDAFGFSRGSDVLDRKLDDAVVAEIDAKKIRREGEFLYDCAQSEIKVRDRQQFPSTLRRLQLISSEEIDGAIEFVIRHACGITPEDLPEAVAGVFGFQTIPQGGDAIVADRLAILSDSGLFEMKDKYLFPRVQ